MDTILDWNLRCDCDLEFSRVHDCLRGMWTVNDESMLEHIEFVAHITQMLHPLHLVPSVANKPFVVEWHRRSAFDEQISVVRKRTERVRFLAISTKTKEFV